MKVFNLFKRYNERVDQMFPRYDDVVRLENIATPIYNNIVNDIKRLTSVKGITSVKITEWSLVLYCVAIEGDIPNKHRSEFVKYAILSATEVTRWTPYNTSNSDLNKPNYVIALKNIENNMSILFSLLGFVNEKEIRDFTKAVVNEYGVQDYFENARNNVLSLLNSINHIAVVEETLQEPRPEIKQVISDYSVYRKPTKVDNDATKSMGFRPLNNDVNKEADKSMEFRALNKDADKSMEFHALNKDADKSMEFRPVSNTPVETKVPSNKATVSKPKKPLSAKELSQALGMEEELLPKSKPASH